MPSTKATGLDDISINVLKLAAPEIVSSITYICNLSLKTATFPAKWKEAKVTPLHKGGSRHDCSNYRPISVLPILSKILEKHVFTHMYAFLQKHNLLTDSQLGFRKQNSCQTALLALTEKMYKAINEGKYFGMTQLDLSKAFDLVNHTILLEKLKLYRCNVESMQWFTSYLESRSQKVCIHKSLSKSISIISGVPQGSILGPLFFILYINDIPLFLSNTEEVIYADDLTLTTMCNNVKTVESNLRIDTGKSFDWCKQNDMVLSLTKCCSMLVASRQKLLKINSKIDIDIGETVIPSVSTTKMLGVHFDDALSWDVHIQNVYNITNKNLYLLQQIKQFLPIDSQKLFFNSYILPHFDYCSIIWGNCSQTQMYRLEKLQKRAARIILDKNYHDYCIRSADLFAELKWMSLKERINYNIAIQVYKCINGLSSQGLENIFTHCNEIHSHSTRSANNLQLYCRPTHHKSFSSRGVNVWNNIPADVRLAKSLSKFKENYISYYFDSKTM